jgi:hypothetical protein
MWPFIKDGDMVSARLAKLSDIKIGDIILYRKNNQLICHRYIGKIKGVFYARADLSPWEWEAVIPEELAGKVFMLVRRARVISLESKIGRLNNYLAVVAAYFTALISRVYGSMLKH